MRKPDNRDPAIVWKYFDLEFEKADFPSVSWAIGSDWGAGTPYGLTAAQYREAAEKRMIAIYGPRPDPA